MLACGATHRWLRRFALAAVHQSVLALCACDSSPAALASAKACDRDPCTFAMSCMMQGGHVLPTHLSKGGCREQSGTGRQDPKCGSAAESFRFEEQPAADKVQAHLQGHQPKHACLQACIACQHGQIAPCGKHSSTVIDKRSDPAITCWVCTER